MKLSRMQSAILHLMHEKKTASIQKSKVRLMAQKYGMCIFILYVQFVHYCDGY